MALTVHFDASDNDNVFTTAGNPPSGNAADGNNVLQWQAEASLDFAARPTSGDGEAPDWDADGINAIGALDFDGLDESMVVRDGDGTTAVTINSMITASAWSALVAFRFTGALSNNGTIYNEDCIFADTGGYWGLMLRDAGTPEIVVYVWDGAAKTVAATIAQDTDYVVRARMESGTIYISVNGGSESSTGSVGNVGALTGNLRLTESLFQSSTPVRIGEIQIYNTGAAADTNAAYSSLQSKWGVGGGASAGLGKLVGGRLVGGILVGSG